MCRTNHTPRVVFFFIICLNVYELYKYIKTVIQDALREIVDHI